MKEIITKTLNRIVAEVNCDQQVAECKEIWRSFDQCIALERPVSSRAIMSEMGMEMADGSWEMADGRWDSNSDDGGMEIV